MTSIAFFLLALLFGNGVLGAQVQKKASRDPSLAVLRHALSTEGRFTRAKDPMHLKIDLWVMRGGRIPAGILNGNDLVASVDDIDVGKLGKTAKEDAVSSVLFPAGSQLSLAVPLDLVDLLGRVPARKEKAVIHTLRIMVKGKPKTTTELSVVSGLDKIRVSDLDPAKTRVALVTNYGSMVVMFRPDKAPLTVQNFLKLSLSGFYDGTRFHRIVNQFMVQGGDPNTKNANPLDDGIGGPGYRIRDEFSNLTHDRGVLSMANLSKPNTGGSQFFILQVKRNDLDGRFSAFGKLSEGLDCLDRIAAVPTGAQPNDPTERSRPLQDVVLKRAIVLPVLR